MLPGQFFRGSASLLLLVSALFEGLPPVCSGATARPNQLWPPDKNLRRIMIEGVTDPDDDPVSITVLSVHQDEPLSSAGQPDASWIGTPQPRVRADRKAGGDGRVYHLRFRAEDGLGETCEGEVTVCVPAAEGERCSDGGPRINSTGS